MLVQPMQSKRLGVGVAVVNRLLYAIGGFDGKTRLASVECYHPENNAWTLVPPMHYGRSGAGVAALHQYIYVVGGFDGTRQLASVERYDTEQQCWDMVASVRIARSALSLTVLDGRLYAIGGYDGQDFLTIVEVYDPTRDVWDEGTPLTSGRSGHASAVIYTPSCISSYMEGLNLGEEKRNDSDGGRQPPPPTPPPPPPPPPQPPASSGPPGGGSSCNSSSTSSSSSSRSVRNNAGLQMSHQRPSEGDGNAREGSCGQEDGGEEKNIHSTRRRNGTVDERNGDDEEGEESDQQFAMDTDSSQDDCDKDNGDDTGDGGERLPSVEGTPSSSPPEPIPLPPPTVSQCVRPLVESASQFRLPRRAPPVHPCRARTKRCVAGRIGGLRRTASEGNKYTLTLARSNSMDRTKSTSPSSSSSSMIEPGGTVSCGKIKRKASNSGIAGDDCPLVRLKKRISCFVSAIVSPHCTTSPPVMPPPPPPPPLPTPPPPPPTQPPATDGILPITPAIILSSSEELRAVVDRRGSLPVDTFPATDPLEPTATRPLAMLHNRQQSSPSAKL